MFAVLRNLMRIYGKIIVGTILLLVWVYIRAQDVNALRREDERNQIEVTNLKKSVDSQKKAVSKLIERVDKIREERIRDTAKIEDLERGRR